MEIITSSILTDTTHTQSDDLLILRPKGKLISICARRFGEYLQKLKDRGLKRLIINLDGVTSIDTVGINMLKRFQQNGLDIYLTNVRHNVAVVFKYADIGQSIKVYPSEKAIFSTIIVKGGESDEVKG
jgi:anti-anti-sigma factor